MEAEQTTALVRASSEPSLAERLKRTAELNTELMKLWPDRGSVSVTDVDHRDLHATGYRQTASGSGDDWMISVRIGAPFEAWTACLYGEWDPSCPICQKLVEFSKDIDARCREILEGGRRGTE